MLRSILLISFSAIIFAAVAFALRWIGSQTAPQLVILLAALGSLNVLFYSRFVRDSALKDNLEDTPIVESHSKHLASGPTLAAKGTISALVA
jgi:hypothetical protein